MSPIAFNDFIRRHRARHASLALPEPETETGLLFYGPWLKAVNANNIDEEAADRASERLVNEPPKRTTDHWPTLRRYMIDDMKSRGGEGLGEYETDRESAEKRSRDCEHCGGEGLATVYHHAGGDRERRIPPRTTAFCVCPKGRWVRRRHLDDREGEARRIPDLADVVAGRSMWRLEAPTLIEGRTR